MILNEQLEDIIRIVKSLEDSGLLTKVVTQTIENGAKEQREGFLVILLGTLSASLLGNILARKGFIQPDERQRWIWVVEGATIRAGEWAKSII